MPRKRMIDPEFWSDEEIGNWSHQARLFYIGLWNFSDDEGKFKAHPSLLKSQIFPYDSKVDINKLQKEITSKIQWYNINGCQYGIVRNFLKHQRIDRPTPSKLPNPISLDENSASPLGDVPPNISKVKLNKDKLIEDKLSLFQDIILDLNSTINSFYKPTTPKTRELISARLKDGFTLEDFKIVHRKMAKAWGVDNKMRQYLRPQTLYSSKFESYLNRPDDLKVGPAGAKTYQAGQEWLKEEKDKENAK